MCMALRWSVVSVSGMGGRRFVVLVAAAVLGAWTGDAISSRLDVDPLRLGDFSLVGASLAAWLGIGLVVAMSMLAPERRAARSADGGIRLELRRRIPSQPADLPPSDGED